MSDMKYFVGGILSIGWIYFSACLLATGWTHGQLGLSGLGGFIGGMVAPLALVWAVVAYLEQARQIRNNSLATKEQGDRQEKGLRELQRLIEAVARQSLALATRDRPFLECMGARIADSEEWVTFFVHNLGGRSAERAEFRLLTLGPGQSHRPQPVDWLPLEPLGTCKVRVVPEDGLLLPFEGLRTFGVDVVYTDEGGKQWHQWFLPAPDQDRDSLIVRFLPESPMQPPPDR